MGKLTDLLKGKSEFETLDLSVKRPTFETQSQKIGQAITGATGGRKLSDLLKQPEPRFTTKPTDSTPIPVDRAGIARQKAEERKTDRITTTSEARQKETTREATLKGAEERLQNLLAEAKEIERSPEPDFARQNELTKQILETRNVITGSQKGFGTGIREAFGFEPTARFGAQQATPERAEAAEQAIETARGQSGFGAGRVVGEIGKQAALYATVGAALKGTELGRALSTQLGSKFGKAGTFAADQLVDLFVDTVIQTPQELKRGDTLGKMGMNRLIDIGMNLGIGIGGEFLKSLKTADSAGFEKAVSALTPEEASKVRNALETKVDVPLGPATNTFEPTKPSVFDTKTDLPTDVDIPVGKPKKLSELLQEKTMAAKIEQPKFTDDTLIVDMPTIAKGEPIDTKGLVTTELPKKSKQTFTERYDRAVQELIGKYDFLEKVSESAKVQSSNLNRTLGSIENSVIKGGNQTNMLGEPIGKSVSDIFENVKKEDTQDVFEYIFHKHNIDRATEGKPVFGETIDSNFSKNFVKDFEAKNPDAIQVQQDITKYFKNLLNEWAVPSGLTSKETAEYLNDLYKNYVPTVRVKNLPKSISQGGQVVAQILKKAKGGDDAILPLDQMMIMQTERVIKNARKNEVLNTLADAFEKGEGNVSKRVFDIKGGEKEILDDAFDIGKSLDVEPVQKGDEYIINF